VRDHFINKWIKLDDEKVTVVEGIEEEEKMLENFYANSQGFGLSRRDFLNHHTGMILFYQRVKQQEVYAEERKVRNIFGSSNKPLIPHSFPLFYTEEVNEKEEVNPERIQINDLKRRISHRYNQSLKDAEMKREERKNLVYFPPQQIKRIMDIFHDMYKHCNYKEFKENIINFNLPFTSSIYWIDSPNSSFLTSFLWTWINYLICVYPYIPHVKEELKQALDEVAVVIKNNRKLLLWFLWFVLKGGNYLIVSLSNLISVKTINPSVLSQHKDFSILSNCLNHMENKELNKILDFLLEILFTSIDFSVESEMIVGMEYFVEICRISSFPANQMEYLCQLIAARLD
jgi:hypothetical protein